MVNDKNIKIGSYSKAAVLLEIRAFEKTYREEANKFRNWYDEMIKKRKAYKEKMNKITDELEYNRKVLAKLEAGENPPYVNFVRYHITPNYEVKSKELDVDNGATIHKILQNEIAHSESEIEGCKYYYDFYTKLINDSIIENRRKEKLSFLASYAVDYLEQGSESIEFNNNRRFVYHTHSEVSGQGALGYKKFIFKEVSFTEEQVKEFLNEFFDYAYEGDNILNHSKNYVADTKRTLIEKADKKRKNEIVKKTFEKISISRANKNKTKTELLNIIANKLNMSFEAAKYNYYFKPKKLEK